jgi:alcohol dehydrogenase class IV
LSTFEFVTATRIIFGAQSVDQVAGIAAGFGQRTLLVTGGQATAAAADRLEDQCRAKGLTVTRYAVNGEPDVATIETGVQRAQSADCDHVIALGGGSVIDAGKAIAGLLTNGGSVLDYVEVVGRGQAIQHPTAPFIAIPTTAGTGTEVTRNAVIAVKEKQVKVSMRSPYLLPRVAVVDPILTHTMPPSVTASTGLDALTQLIEPFTSIRRNPMTDAIAEAGLKRAANALLPAYSTGDPVAREAMVFASLCGGLALANAGLGAVHGFAGVLGGIYPIAHGVCCATLLPHVIEANITALIEREPSSPVLDRYRIIAEHLIGIAINGNHVHTRGVLVDHITDLCQTMGIPPLSEFGVTADAIPQIVAQSQQASSMKANPLPLTTDELSRILTKAL